MWGTNQKLLKARAEKAERLLAKEIELSDQVRIKAQLVINSAEQLQANYDRLLESSEAKDELIDQLLDALNEAMTHLDTQHDLAQRYHALMDIRRQPSQN